MEIKKFYGEKRLSSTRSKSWEQKRAKLEHLASEYRKHPILRTRIPRIGEPSPVFSQWFPRQHMAFEFARTCHKDVHVFAEERSSDGKRHYLVSTLPAFWDVYRRLDREDRHYYEVIMLGAACRLYFDLEFKKDLNPDSNGPEMVETFKKLICRSLYSLFKVNCEKRNILDLDSSTTSKFSRHLIFHIPGAVFQDNINAGNFVHHVCTLVMKKTRHHLESSQTYDPSVSSYDSDAFMDTVTVEELSTLMVKNDKGEWMIFCDQGVYTKNRNFRLYKSTKVGRNAPLLLAKENQFKVSLKNKKSSVYRDEEYLLFLESLICNVSPQTSSGQDVRVITCESCKPISRLQNGRMRSTEDQEGEEDYQSGCQYSPYPDIDRFISNNISRGGVKGHIRRWVYFQQGKTLTYDILNNRWCENIGRSHKSNHIMMVVDLEHGVYYQKCHDPDCRRANFRSKELPLPDLVCPFTLNEGLALCSEEDEDEELLCRAAAEGETQYQLQCNIDVSHLASVSEKTSFPQLATSLDNQAVALEGIACPLKVTELHLQNGIGMMKERQKIAAELTTASDNVFVKPGSCNSPSTRSFPLHDGEKPNGTQELVIDGLISNTNVATGLTQAQIPHPTAIQNETIDSNADVYYFNASKELGDNDVVDDYIDDAYYDEESVLASLKCLETSSKASSALKRTQVFCRNEPFLPLMLTESYEADTKTNCCEDMSGSLVESHHTELTEPQTLVIGDNGQSSIKPLKLIDSSGWNTDVNDKQISGDIQQGGFLQQSGEKYCSGDDCLHDSGMLSGDLVEEQLLIDVVSQIERLEEDKLSKRTYTQGKPKRPKQETLLRPVASDTSSLPALKPESERFDPDGQFTEIEISTDSNTDIQLNNSSSVRHFTTSVQEAFTANTTETSLFVGDRVNEYTNDKEEVELERVISVAFDMFCSSNGMIL